MPSLLTQTEIAEALSEIEEWELSGEDGSITRLFVFDGFDQAMSFIQAIADVARRMDHHSEIYNVYNEVALSLITHDAGGVTRKDVEFAREANRIWSGKRHD